MLNPSPDRFFAAAGDVHGHLYAMTRMLQAWESRNGHQLAFVLQVGDFEPHRDETDVATMDAPSKYRKVGDFPDFYTRRAVFPWPVWFIGGNHEPYGFLDRSPQGATIAPNCHYLGRVGAVELAGLKVVGVSGIYRQEQFTIKRPDVSQLGHTSNKEYIGFTEEEIDRALELKSADILLLHEWPSGIVHPSHAGDFYGEVGNEYARMLVEYLAPRLVLCGHLHKRYRTRISLATNILTDICCLANVQQGKDAIAFFRLTPEGEILEVSDTERD